MKTKKLWMILLAFLLMGGTVSAQLRFGIRGEVGINKPSFTKDV
ncbi:MAG TPA: PorT family protein, partial [Porphyromonadaceae bacterium]|nr:PorT family protein [Porphyromonadaceae bacterium]